MEYNEFLDRILEETRKLVPPSIGVTRGSVLKINDTKLDNLTFCELETTPKVAQCIHVNGYYDEDITEEDIEDLAKRIIYSVKNNSEFTKTVINRKWDFENVKDCIIPMLVNPDLNREYLLDMPHRPWLNLEIIYTVDKEDMNMKIHTSNMELWGITEEELFNIAMDNLERKAREAIKVPEKIPQPGDSSNSKPYDIFVGDITDTFKLMKLGIIANEVPKYAALDLINLLKNPSRENQRDLLIVTNYRRENPAFICFSKEFMSHIAELIDSSFYFTMNTFHEVIIKKETEDRKKYGSGLTEPFELTELRDVCREAFRNLSSNYERLSASVYYYDRETKQVSLI